MLVVVLQMTKIEGETKAQLLSRTSRQIEAFTKVGFETKVVVAKELSENELIEACKEADVLYCNGNPPITKKLMLACPHLKLVQRAGIGTDSVDAEGAAELGIPVFNVTGYCVEELAVHATALILSNLRTITFYDREIRKGNWPKAKGRMPLRCSKMTLGIFGLGGSGKNMAKIWGQGFGSRLIAFDPFVPENKAAEIGVELVDFETLCKESDVISIHAPLTDSTRHAFNEKAFSMMKPNCIIVNTSRGPIIDEQALVNAIQSGKIAAAGIDTFENEPPEKDSPLFALEKESVLTPHSAYCGKEASSILVKIACELVIRFINRKELYLPYLVNRSISSEIGKNGISAINRLITEEEL